MLAIGIFVYTVSITRFTDRWSELQFLITPLSLLASWATTRRWTWSWLVWMTVNVISVPYDLHFAARPNPGASDRLRRGSAALPETAAASPR